VRVLYSRSYLENQMAVALGGRVAEELIFGEDNVTTGASNDFMQVTNPGPAACSSSCMLH
jgi:cell division protease FtsH